MRAWVTNNAGRLAVVAVVAVAVLAVVLTSDEKAAPAEKRPDRLPGEYLYLDGQRTDAYLGQLKEGISSQREQSGSAKQTTSGKITAKDVVEIGATVETTTSVTETVSSTAADRFYQLENRLKEGFGDNGDDKMTTVNAEEASECKALQSIGEGGFVRVTNLRMLVPTFALPLSRLAHAEQFLAPGIQSQGVTVRRGRDSLLTLAASREGPSLRKYVRRFGLDPVVPVRANVPAMTASGTASADPPCLQMLMLLRYSNLADAPALLTGGVTLVGKVIRRLPADTSYFDVQSAVTYTRALQRTGGRIRKILQVPAGQAAQVVNEAARLRAPGAVILPIAIYK